MRKRIYILSILFGICLLACINEVSASRRSLDEESSLSSPSERPMADKILFIGDSMTGWMSERMYAYGTANGFDVATVVWDGSTISKWGANTGRLSQLISQIRPDAIFVCLGLNELAEKNPESKLGAAIARIKKAAGSIPVIWVGPPAWPGKPWGETLDRWLASKMGEGHYYSSLHLKLGRQSASNPHPSREGMNVWVDSLMDWMPENAAIQLPGYSLPTSSRFLRPKTYIYRKMKQQL